MSEKQRPPKHWSKKVRDGAKVALGVASTVAVGGGLTTGCLDRPIDNVEPRTTSTNVQRLTQSSVDKIDVLLVIDNSRSMADKQQVLAAAVPKLVERLVTPLCVNEEGEQAEPDEEGNCADGFKPEFEAVRDINIGIVSSSIGSAGSAICDPQRGSPTPNDQDYGHLIWRSQACLPSSDPSSCPNDVPTYENLGFLAWDPDGDRPCPGQDVGGDKCPGEDVAGDLIGNLRSMVTGVGEFGCGFEAPLEAAYRFLVDPKPWLSLPSEGASEGVDEVLLDQRAKFLRPDSLVAVILLTDENDCSISIGDGIGHIAATVVDGQGGGAMPRAREECATDPKSECCTSCILPTPDGCSGDGGCPDPGNPANAANFYPPPGNNEDGTLDESNVFLRCHDQKRRYGIDFLYPTQRYVNAFSQVLINPDNPDLSTGGDGDVANPLFTDLLDLGRSVRAPDLVFVAGIAGVPWQLIARKNGDDQPDLNTGLDLEGNQVGGFQNYDELAANGVWEQLIPLGDSQQAGNPLMIESAFPRDGLSTEVGSNPINGHEYDTGYIDLQYACIFQLPPGQEKDCAADATACDCTALDDADKPLCASNPNDEGNATLQTHAKAYPGTRIFEVLYGLGPQGIPASICPAQLNPEADNAKDYGYTPAVFAIIDRLKTKLGGACQPRRLIAEEETGNVPCLVIEARDSDGDRDAASDGKCTCKLDGRRDPVEGGAIAADQIREELKSEVPSPGYDCLCEVVQLQGDPADEDSDRYHCQNDQNPPQDVNGWCYVDATAVPPIGNPELVSACPASEQRLVRFVNEGEVKAGGRLYITCSGDVAE